jgi:glutamate synthase (ferredoxin)
MTGGRVIVLGTTGRNFAAGMSGGVAFLLDEKGDAATRINTQMVGLKKLDDPEEINEVRQMLQRHATYTGSAKANAVLANWETMVSKFIKVLPKDYERMLGCIKKAHDQGLTGEEAIMTAFEENARDLSRVGGN